MGKSCPHCNGTGFIENPSIGTLILAARKASGMTQEELSRAVRKSRTQIANIEAGRTDFPTSLLFEFATALNCEVKELIP